MLAQTFTDNFTLDDSGYISLLILPSTLLWLILSIPFLENLKCLCPSVKYPSHVCMWEVWDLTTWFFWTDRCQMFFASSTSFLLQSLPFLSCIDIFMLTSVLDLLTVFPPFLLPYSWYTWPSTLEWPNSHNRLRKKINKYFRSSLRYPSSLCKN